MISVEFSSSLTKFTNGVDSYGLEDSNNLCDDLVNIFPDIRNVIFDSSGELMPFVSMFIDGIALASIQEVSEMKFKKVKFLMSVAGG